MSDANDEDYVYDEASGEWISAAAAKTATEADGAVEVRDAVGNLLMDGDQVTLIKDLTVKGAGQTLKRGTLIKSIRLTGDAQEIDCRFDGIKGLVLRAEFVRSRDSGTRVLAVSGLADEDAGGKHPSLTFGDAKLGKPFTAASLLRKVGELLEVPRA